MKKIATTLLILSLIMLIGCNKVDHPAPVDYSCQADDDCKLDVPSKLAECLPCDPYGCNSYNVDDALVEAVNINWKPSCPKADLGQICAACIGSISGEHRLQCTDNKCQKIITP